MSSSLADAARDIWRAAVDAVRPEVLLPAHVGVASLVGDAVAAARRVLVVGAGKAGAAMSAALEEALAQHIHKLVGVVNVPANAVRPLKRIRLHAARPAASNHPTADGVAGAEEMLALLQGAGPDDIAICLLSGGGSALLPAPDGVSLADKQAVTKLLHACGATIQEMNAVRKHLSRIKGGRLAQSFPGRSLFSLIISDVIGDPLDVIASGPTAADPTTFGEALAVLDRYDLRRQCPPGVVEHLERGARGLIPETPKSLPANVHNVLIGSNAVALSAAVARAATLGFAVVNLGSCIDGETRVAASSMADVVRSIKSAGQPVRPPACLLSGGETTVTLGPDPGQGGRNQEFVLAMLERLGEDGMRGVCVLSGGTDGEDGPTDAAGAYVDEKTWPALRQSGLNAKAALDQHDAYPFFEKLGCLLRPGLTNTNVMDVRVILVS